MSLAEDLAALGAMAADLAVEGDPARAVAALELLAIVMPRRCLRCQKMFDSEGPGNRLCQPCKSNL